MDKEEFIKKVREDLYNTLHINRKNFNIKRCETCFICDMGTDLNYGINLWTRYTKYNLCPKQLYLINNIFFRNYEFDADPKRYSTYAFAVYPYSIPFWVNNGLELIGDYENE